MTATVVTNGDDFVAYIDAEYEQAIESGVPWEWFDYGIQITPLRHTQQDLMIQKHGIKMVNG